VIAEPKTSTVALPSVVATEDGDIKKGDTSAPIAAIPASDQSVPGPIAATSQTATTVIFSRYALQLRN
jgi:hypothetical protein